MIRINVLGKLDPVHAAIIKFKQDLRARSFTDRHPELGKMVNCAVCGNRHYSSKICVQKFTTHDRHGDPYFEDGSPLIAPLEDEVGFFSKNAFFGADKFKGKRKNPHKNLHPRRERNITELYEFWQRVATALPDARP